MNIKMRTKVIILETDAQFRNMTISLVSGDGKSRIGFEFFDEDGDPLDLTSAATPKLFLRMAGDPQVINAAAPDMTAVAAITGEFEYLFTEDDLATPGLMQAEVVLDYGLDGQLTGAEPLRFSIRRQFA